MKKSTITERHKEIIRMLKDGYCEYCEGNHEPENVGYIPTYNVVVCVDCYKEHHGI